MQDSEGGVVFAGMPAVAGGPPPMTVANSELRAKALRLLSQGTLEPRMG